MKNIRNVAIISAGRLSINADGVALIFLPQRRLI